MHAVATHEMRSITGRRRPVAHLLIATTSQSCHSRPLTDPTAYAGVYAPVTALVWPDSVTSWLAGMRCSQGSSASSSTPSGSRCSQVTPP
jgi:hypothetical protein